MAYKYKKGDVLYLTKKVYEAEKERFSFANRGPVIVTNVDKYNDGYPYSVSWTINHLNPIQDVNFKGSELERLPIVNPEDYV